MKRNACMWLFILAAGAACKARPVYKPAAEAPMEMKLPGKYGPKYNANNLIITYSKTVGNGPLLKAIEAYGARLLHSYTIINAVAIEKPAGKSLSETAAWFNKVKGVIRVERDAIMTIDRQPGGRAE